MFSCIDLINNLSALCIKTTTPDHSAASVSLVKGYKQPRVNLVRGRLKKLLIKNEKVRFGYKSPLRIPEIKIKGLRKPMGSSHLFYFKRSLIEEVPRFVLGAVVAFGVISDTEYNPLFVKL